MSKVRINDLARELEVKPRAIIDILSELGVSGPKTHSSSLELDEAEKVRSHFGHETKHGSGSGSQSRHAAPSMAPKIDLSHISKPGDVLKAILAKKKEEEEEVRHLTAVTARARSRRGPVRSRSRGAGRRGDS